MMTTITFEFPGWKKVVHSRAGNYERLDQEKFKDAYEIFCFVHGIKKRRLKITPPSSNGTWSYSFKVKCTDAQYESLRLELNKVLKDMGV